MWDVPPPAPRGDQGEEAAGLAFGTARPPNPAGLQRGLQGSRILPSAACLSPRPQLSPGSEEDEVHEGCSRENLGRIQFSVGYNFQESTLTVKIMKAQELPAKDFSGTSDPFVKIYLLPDKKHKLETKVKRKNLNPHWNETFLFEGEAVLPLPPESPSSPPPPPPTLPPPCDHMHKRTRTGARAHARTNTQASNSARLTCCVPCPAGMRSQG